MPALRTMKQSPHTITNPKVIISSPAPSSAPVDSRESQERIYYPLTQNERASFKTTSGKRVTPHQWAVYDFSKTIPLGKVTTYKDVAAAVGGSPRSVGGALRHNPFAPYIPCHRVIASDLFVGGYLGEWGKDSKTGTQCNRKLELLTQEGVSFSESGHLQDSDQTLWKPK